MADKSIINNMGPLGGVSLANGKNATVYGNFTKNITYDHIKEGFKKIDGKVQYYFEPEVCGEVLLNGILFIADGNIIDEKTPNYQIKGSAPIKQKWGECWDSAAGPHGKYYEYKGQLAFDPPIKWKLKKYTDHENGTIETEAPVELDDIEKLKKIFLNAF